MKTVRFRTGLYPGSQRPYYFLVSDNGVTFLSKPQDGAKSLAVCTDKTYNKNGKWSGWIGFLTLADRVELVELVANRYQTLADTLGSFEAVAAKHGATAGDWRWALEQAAPKAAAELVRRAAELAELEAES